MPKVEMEGSLQDQFNGIEGGEGGQGDPGKAQYVDPNAKVEVEAEAEEIDDENEAEEAAENESEEDADDAEGSDEEQSEEAENEPKKSAKSRINELTRARREAERERDYWRKRAQEAGQKVAAPPVGITEEEPDPSKYDYGDADPAYYRDLARYEAKKALDEERSNRAKSEYTDALKGAFDATIQNGRVKFADFDKVVLDGASNGSWECSEELFQQLIDTDRGDELAYYLAKNPTEARRISALPFRTLAREIGKLEVQIDELSAVKKPKVASDVPPPPKRYSRGGGVRAGGFDAEGSSFAEFEQWANKQPLGRRR